MQTKDYGVANFHTNHERISLTYRSFLFHEHLWAITPSHSWWLLILLFLYHLLLSSHVLFVSIYPDVFHTKISTRSTMIVYCTLPVLVSDFVPHRSEPLGLLHRLVFFLPAPPSQATKKNQNRSWRIAGIGPWVRNRIPTDTPTTIPREGFVVEPRR